LGPWTQLLYGSTIILRAINELVKLNEDRMGTAALFSMIKYLRALLK
jgi:hypothetical protein